MASEAERVGRIRFQYVWQAGLRHFLDRRFRIGIKKGVNQIDRLIARQHLNKSKRIEPASGIIAVAEKKRRSAALFSAGNPLSRHRDAAHHSRCEFVDREHSPERRWWNFLPGDGLNFANHLRR